MRLSELPIKEVDSQCGFPTRKQLVSHVVKHVLEDRDELWHRLLDADTIAQARRDYEAGRYTPAFWRVAEAYGAKIGGAVLKACQEGCYHSHNAMVDSWNYQTIATPLETEVKGELVYAWPPDDRFFISAGSYVTNDSLTPYTLRTGYRAWPKVARKRFLASAREKALEIKRLLHPPIAVHDLEGGSR